MKCGALPLPFKLLDKEDKECANWILKNFFNYEAFNCWDMKPPKDFENHKPLKELLAKKE